MTLFFNYEKLFRLLNGNIVLMLEVLRHKYYKTLPQGKLLYLSDKIDKVAGISFILNPEAILKDRITDISYIAQYIQLAARRDYTLYNMYSVTYLPLSYFPEIDISKIKHNPLLVVKDNNIYFKYEEQQKWH